MKILLVFLIIVTANLGLKAQVTIGSGIAPSNGALLDIKEKNANDGEDNSTKGILFPRVKLTDMTKLSPMLSGVDLDDADQKLRHKGLIVYNVGAAFKEGLYSWDGTQWNLFNQGANWVNDPNNAMVKLGTQSNGLTTRPAGTEFVAKDNGFVGIGTSNPGAALEINSNVANASGLKFTQLKSTTPPTAGVANLGIDANGNVAVAAAAPGASATIVGGSISGGSNFSVNGQVYTTVPNSGYPFTVPAGGKVLFLTYMLGVDVIGAPFSGFQFYQCQLFIDGVATGLFIGAQEPGGGDGQMQFTVGGVLNLSAGSHTIDARIIRIKNNLNSTSQTFSPITSNFSAAYIN